MSMVWFLQRKFNKYEIEIKNLVSENEKLRRALEEGGTDPEAIDKLTW